MDTPVLSERPIRTITIEEYYAWSAEGLDEMTEFIEHILEAHRESLRRILQHAEQHNPDTVLSSKPSRSDLYDAAGLLSFLERVPDGDVRYEEAIFILAIRHDTNNVLQVIFTPEAEEPSVRARLNRLFARFSVLRTLHAELRQRLHGSGQKTAC